jgi:hypothetical protein
MIYRLNLILILKSLLIVAFILTGNIGLGPDEAQYWTWSQSLDWGYYSKPPAIAWQIWLGTKLFGNTELGVRFFSILISYAISLTIYFTSLACRTTTKTAFWAALVYAFSPLGILGSLFAITDGGMVLCWSLATLIMAGAIATNQAPNYLKIGFILFCGSLFKWPIYLFWPLVCVCLPFRRSLYKPQLFVGILISLLGLFPSIIWNSSHHWVTFRHVLATVHTPHIVNERHPAQGNFFEFIGAQAALLSPILFVIALASLVYIAIRFKKIPPALKFCAIPSFSLIFGFAIVAFFKKIQGNWCDFAYPGAIVFLSWYACERSNWALSWLKAGTATSLFLVSAIFTIPIMQAKSLLPYYIPYKANPFKHNLGWGELNSLLEEVGYDSKQNFLFGDKYQTSSILSFYSPGQKRAYFLNLQSIRKNQFSFWPSLAQEQLGKDGYFVLTENFSSLEKQELFEKQVPLYEQSLKDYFHEIEFLGFFPLFECNGQSVKAALIFKCTKYNGKEPPEVELY